MRLYLDIETLPADLTPEQIADLAREEVPGNYKKPEAIEAWVAENAGGVHARTALKSMEGRILMLAWAVDDKPVQSVYLDNPKDPRPVLDALLSAVAPLRSPTWIGHNIAGFDLPYLRHVAFRARHPVATAIPHARYSPAVVDTMQLWSGTNPRPDYVGLARLASFLGVPAKVGDIDGSKVFDAWKAGRHAEIRTYGEGDVETVRAVHQVMVGE